MSTLASRQRLATAALAERALLVAAHIPTAGRLVSAGVGAQWEAIALPA